ncbi:hypothetical protein IW140_005533 [Coemansia sp. RSA 1813]|nr:hypothetical protein EV178_005523 [Coemansia sp. RSA 1646]KAJ1765980.1 hypothetical protein LPJ74_006110 [Coemansia sp. RSA 1843]KAJ2086803.1 hypothetical protein IW138_005430 [Coemansia sp. RSA 986]KAJ2211380.1 hypothetical protein EV179_005517 [Coemansia sp. RSA 487]KAJ2564951.1 hypothetical protein IW140_005533 [Coemansia sp. RSA 1813]
MNHFTIASLVILALCTLYSLHRLPAAGDRCTALLETGWWTNKHSLVWQPQGCTLKQYKQPEIRQCLGQTTALFVGDSSVRNKFFALARAVDPKFTPPNEKAHQNIDVLWPATTDKNSKGGDSLAARFLWDPYLNLTETHDALNSKERKIAVVGSGLWYLRNRAAGSGGVKAWRKAIDKMSDKMNVYISPIPHIVPERLSQERRETLDAESIHLMNEYMSTQVAHLQLFRSWNLMALPEETQDGLHYSNRVEDRAINVLLNRACNMVTVPAHAPFRTTCCVAYPSPPWLVVGAALLTCIGIPALLYSQVRNSAATMPSIETLRQMLVFGAILLLMYVCDRTPVFDKLQKNFVVWVFWLLVGASAAWGVATWEKDAKGGGGFLGRLQTDEWKGWMQLLILAYHLMNASTVAGIYNPVRVLVAMYLFMTGYGHCFFFHKKADFGLRRLTAVLLRTNLLAVGLAYMMGTSYMDYYFAPLSSVWVLIVWLTMRVAPQANHTHVVWVKIAVSAIAAKAVNDWWHLWPFGLLRRLGVDWSQREWEFRFGTDIFIVYVGMATAIVVLHHGAQLQAHARWLQMKRWATLASVVGLLWYTVFELTRIDKFAYNAWHPYVSIVPVLSFVVLRNSSEYLRMHSSSAFRFVGLISLELFIAQFHLFLAADTKAVLVLSDSRLWFINLALVCVVFFTMCQLLGNASTAICAWLMVVRTSSSGAQQQQHRPAANDAAIPMTELPVVQPPAEQPSAAAGHHRPAALDRLASDPPIAARLFDSLAARWVVGLATLVLINWIY